MFTRPKLSSRSSGDRFSFRRTSAKVAFLGDSFMVNICFDTEAKIHQMRGVRKPDLYKSCAVQSVLFALFLALVRVGFAARGAFKARQKSLGVDRPPAIVIIEPCGAKVFRRFKQKGAQLRRGEF